MSERQRYIVEVFTKAIERRSGNAQRLRNGLFLRQQFQNALGKGLIPTHPRWEWLRRQSRTMLELLLVMAKDYDKLGTVDKSSMPDLLDICDMTQGTIKGAIAAGIMDPEDVKLIPFEEVVQEKSMPVAPPEDEDDEET